MSTVYKCQKCGGVYIASYNSMFPPIINENDKKCECSYPGLIIKEDKDKEKK